MGCGYDYRRGAGTQSKEDWLADETDMGLPRQSLRLRVSAIIKRSACGVEWDAVMVIAKAQGRREGRMAD